MAEENTTMETKEENQEPPSPKAAEPKAEPRPPQPSAPEKPRTEGKPASENPKPESQPPKIPSEAPAPREAMPGTKPAGEKAAEDAKDGAGSKPMPCQEAGLKAFNRWDTGEIKLSDPGMARYINLDCMSVPRTGGKYGSGRWTKDRMSIIERFMNRLQNTGHRGKKHKISSGNHAGKISMLYSTMKQSFIIIEKKTKKNPIQVLVEAVENSGPLEEVASYRLGGIIARNSVVTSPQRRLDLALRHLTQGIFRTSFRNKKSLANVIADELIAASQNDTKCFAIMERNRLEKESEGAR